MAIQPDPTLRAAVRWLERLSETGIGRARSLLVTNPRLADLTPTQYETALSWLQRTGLLEANTVDAPPAIRVFEVAVREASWFDATDALVRDPSELPQDALSAAAALEIDEQDAFQHLQSAWGKVDIEARERVGAAGEAQLVELLARSVTGEVAHVSQWSDALGYDIAVSAPPEECHLEVKSTTHHGRLTFYLSRNEYNVLRRDPQWVLAAVTLSDDLRLTRIRTVLTDWIIGSAPQDKGSEGRWESCRFDVPEEATVSGLPALRSMLRDTASPLLSGSEPEGVIVNDIA